MPKYNKRDHTKRGNLEPIARAQTKRRNVIGSVLYTIFVFIYTALLVCAIVNPTILPLEYFREFEVLPKPYDVKLFWQSFGMLDPIWYGLIYIALTFGGYYFMLEREPLNLVYCQRCCNITLAVFSVWCAIRISDLMVKLLSPDGTISTLPPLIDNICNGKIQDVYLEQIPFAFYTILFLFSKYFEFLDTFFLIVHKKKLLTLHWWHHFSISVFVAYGGMARLSIAIWMGTMNYIVHGYMYTYYAIASFGYRPSRWAMAITILQITQMIIGLLLVVGGIYGGYTKPGCVLHKPSANGMYLLMMSFCIYGSYFVLFVNFYSNRYIKPKKLKSL